MNEDPKPTGDPARDAQLYGGDCWLIERIGVYPSWLDRQAWRSHQAVYWQRDAAEALAFPTQAEAEMFAREYFPEAEGSVLVTGHTFVAPR
jgi:hypothetical protein